MDATKGRLGLFSFGVWLLWSLAMIGYVWAQGEVSFIATRHVRGAENAVSITVGDFNATQQRPFTFAVDVLGTVE